MSWETLVTGGISFKKGTPEELKQKIIEELEAAFETKLKYNEEHDTYEFEDVNWISHVTEKKIQAVYQKWKPFFTEFSVSLYYLSEANYYEHACDDDQDKIGILEKLVDGIVSSLNPDEQCSADTDYSTILQTLSEFLRFADLNREIVIRKMAELTEALSESDVQENKGILMKLVSVLEEKYSAPIELKKLVLAVNV